MNAAEVVHHDVEVMTIAQSDTGLVVFYFEIPGLHLSHVVTAAAAYDIGQALIHAYLSSPEAKPAPLQVVN